MDIREYVVQKSKCAKAAARGMSMVDTKTKNEALIAMAKALIENTDYILAQNSIDIENGKAKGFSNALLDRLLLTGK